jgi:hypothetical protein
MQQASGTHRANQQTQHQGHEAVDQAPGPAGGGAVRERHDRHHHPFGQKHDAHRRGQGLELKSGRNKAGLELKQHPQARHQEQVETTSRQK